MLDAVKLDPIEACASEHIGGDTKKRLVCDQLEKKIDAPDKFRDRADAEFSKHPERTCEKQGKS